MQLDARQLKAVEILRNPNNRIASVTGPAGTGKTTLMRNAYDELTGAGYSCAVAAFIGKAAKRVFEATGIMATTVHRLLEFPMPGEVDEKTGKHLLASDPKRDRYNPLDYDFVFVDEYSTVNKKLHAQLIDALKPGARLRCMGDIFQLEPIEEDKSDKLTPSAFTQMLQKFPSVYLEEIYRSGGSITSNGVRIKNGNVPCAGDDFTMRITGKPLTDLEAVFKDEYLTLSHQIISPMKVRWCGQHAINTKIQGMAEDEMRTAYTLERHSWDDKLKLYCTVRVGSKIVFNKNDYNIEVMNGEVGIIKDITELGEITVDFGDREVMIPPDISFETGPAESKFTRTYNPQRDISLAYALTTHRCIGSEYDEVIYIMHRSMYGMQTRANLYTATTRARKKVTLITDGISLRSAVSKVKADW